MLRIVQIKQISTGKITMNRNDLVIKFSLIKYMFSLKADHTSNDARRANVRDSSPLPVPSQSD